MRTQGAHKGDFHQSTKVINAIDKEEQKANRMKYYTKIGSAFGLV